MQTKILFPLIMLCMSVVSVAQQPFYASAAHHTGIPAKENSFSLSVVPDESTAAFRLYVYNPQQKNIQLRISHQVMGIVVDTSFADSQFSSKYNFEQADDGRYVVTLICGKEKVSKKIEITTVTRRNLLVE